MFVPVFRVSDYRRKHVELYSHDLFRGNNSEATEVRKKSAMEAMEDARSYLLQGGQLAVSGAACRASDANLFGRPVGQEVASRQGVEPPRPAAAARKFAAAAAAR